MSTWWCTACGSEGARVEALVEFVDIFPTLVELCGLPERKVLEGTSTVPLLQDSKRPWKKGAFSVTGSPIFGRNIRTERWRYTEWGPDKVAELYDHKNDPSEYTNLARDPAFAEKVKELKKILHAGWKAALP